MKNLIIAFVLFSICACVDEIDGNQVELKNGFYCHKRGNLVNGNVLYTNSYNTPAFKVRIVNGIPSGKWMIYGFQHDVVQFGEYTTLSFKNTPTIIKRIQKYTMTEGTVSDTFFIVITKQKVNANQKRGIEKWLENNKISSLKIKFKDKEF